MNEFKDKTALVIGGSGGIGSAISERLSEICGKVIVHGGHDSLKFEKLIERMKKNCATVEKFVFDFDAISDLSEIESTKLFDIAKNVDILVFCYGPFLQKPIDSMTISEWKKIALFDYAIQGAFVSASLQNMMKNNFGRIILFGGTGTAHRTEFSTNAAYAGAKTAIGTLVESVAFSYADFGITCNAILPGFTQTEYTTQIDSILNEKMPLKKQISVDSIAKSVIFLIGNADLNGVLLRVDRGWSPLKSRL